MATHKEDAVLAAAVDLAREAAESIAERGTVGDHLGMEMDDERLATHYFACTATLLPGLALGDHHRPRAAGQDRDGVRDQPRPR